MPFVVASQCNRRNRWRNHRDISLIEVRVTYLVDLGLGIVSSPRLLVGLVVLFVAFDTKSFTVCTNIFLGKFVNGFCANNETILLPYVYGGFLDPVSCVKIALLPLLHDQ